MPRTKKQNIQTPTPEQPKSRGGKPKGAPKTGGRQKGTPNRVNSDLKKWVHDFLANNTATFEQHVSKLSKEEQIAIMMSMIPKLLPFVIPKQTENSVSLDDSTMKAIIEAQSKVNALFTPPDKQKDS